MEAGGPKLGPLNPWDGRNDDSTGISLMPSMSTDKETYVEMQRLMALLSPEAALCFRRQEWSLPQEEFEKAMGADSKNFYARLGVAVCCAHSGKAERAAGLLLFMHRSDPSQALLDDYPTIVEVVTHCLEGKPAVWLLLAEELLLQGDREQAAHISEEILPYAADLPKFLHKRWTDLDLATHGGARRPSIRKVPTGCMGLVAVALVGALGWWWWSTTPQRVLAVGEANLFRGYMALLHFTNGQVPPRAHRPPKPSAPRSPSASPVPSPSPSATSDARLGAHEYLEKALEQFEWLLRREPEDTHALFCAYQCCAMLLQTVPDDAPQSKELRGRMSVLDKLLSSWKEARSQEQDWYDKRCRALQEGKVQEL